MTSEGLRAVRILHVGAGSSPLPSWLPGEYEEVRLDIDEKTNPDIVASITDLGEIGQFGAVYASHVLEHVYPDEVVPALKEFHRVLLPGGKAIIFVPDLEDARPTGDVIYECDVGTVCGLDLFYGHSGCVEASRYYAHHCGFTRHSLYGALVAAGFDAHCERMNHYQLMGVGTK